jgi:hypothetical protein
LLFATQTGIRYAYAGKSKFSGNKLMTWKANEWLCVCMDNTIENLWAVLQSPDPMRGESVTIARHIIRPWDRTALNPLSQSVSQKSIFICSAVSYQVVQADFPKKSSQRNFVYIYIYIYLYIYIYIYTSAFYTHSLSQSLIAAS